MLITICFPFYQLQHNWCQLVHVHWLKSVSLFAVFNEKYKDVPKGSAAARLLQQRVLRSELAPSTPGDGTCVKNYKLHFFPFRRARRGHGHCIITCIMCPENKTASETQSGCPGETQVHPAAKGLPWPRSGATRWGAARRVSNWSELTSSIRNGALEREMSKGEDEEGENNSACPSGWDILICAHYFTNKTHVSLSENLTLLKGLRLKARTQGLHTVNYQTYTQIFFHYNFLTRNIIYILVQLKSRMSGGSFFGHF